ncbi:unnamed protein product [Lepeophtheirus salmonis]|uniref:(salmon louse) hypothetical protein n=1 Tax=Lepeophtheirus salmonis TaxID=72036 RepID=A0A7R8CLP6_LEPSM|nr:unnamed protein product [Lepeophtheirus salmonis]CAF2860177.1 unnamed protein product [Lepeophtheirus salmonis]
MKILTFAHYSYGVGQVGAASSGGAVSTSAGGSEAGGAGLSFWRFSTVAEGSTSGPAAPVVPILSATNNAPENGIKQEAVGSTVTNGEESVVTMKGSYEYSGPDGQTYVVDWIADDNGFQPSATGGAGGFGGSDTAGGAGGFGQSFGASCNKPSVPPLSSNGRK